MSPTRPRSMACGLLLSVVSLVVAAGPAVHDAKAFYTTTSHSLASGYAWSADDRKLLLHSDGSGVFNVYALPVGGEAQTALTASTTNALYGVSWFPKDDRALVRGDQAGNEMDHVYVREASGALRDLIPGANTIAEFAGWAADEQSFLVVSNERDPKSFDLYRHAIDGYQRTLVFKNESSWDIAAVSPDEHHLALLKRNGSADSDIHLFDTRDPKSGPKLITRHQGDVSHGVYQFSPDGKYLYYSTDEFGEFRQAWTYELATGRKSRLIAADGDVSLIKFSKSGRYRVSGKNEDARTVVKVLDTSNGREVTLPALPPGDISGVNFSRDERQLALMLGSDTSPNDVYSIDLQSRASKRLTQAQNPAISEADLVASQNIRYPSFDGLQIPALLYRPKTAVPTHRVPAVIWVHGGPGGQSRTGYSAMIQHLVNHGYAVLAANNRGSSGYGKTFFHADDKRHGDVDLKDIVAGKDFLASLDWVDGARIGIMGHSYGGYMVGAALAFSPQTFDVGIDIFGVMNWVRTLNSVPPSAEYYKKSLYDELGDPAHDSERHRRISPLFHAKNIRVPLLVVQGANDARVLQAESDEIVAAVKANGVPVEYVLFPDEGHGFTKRANNIKASETYLAFLDRYLK